MSYEYEAEFHVVLVSNFSEVIKKKKKLLKSIYANFIFGKIHPTNMWY